MEKPGDLLLLVLVCLLLVIVLSAVESGKIVGAIYSTRVPWNQNGFEHPLNSTVTNSTISTATSGVSMSTASPPAPSTPPTPSPFPPFALLVIPGWLLTTIAVGCFVGACFLIFRSSAKVRVIDLEETLREMEAQQKQLAESWSSWSSRLRNAALLRYYLLMKSACAKVGLQDEASETPQEYIRRVSSSLNVKTAEASKFADIVDKARYGEELSREDASEASKFISDFTEVIRGKTNAF